MESEQVEQIMYALAVNRRPRSRTIWLRFNGINKIFKFKRFSLLRYWENRIREEPLVMKWAGEIYEEYLENLNHQPLPLAADGERISEREEICSRCEWREVGGINNVGVCGQCGCNIWAKIRLPAESCPNKKW